MKRKPISSTNYVRIPFGRFHSDRVRVNRKEQRQMARAESRQVHRTVLAVIEEFEAEDRQMTLQDEYRGGECD